MKPSWATGSAVAPNRRFNYSSGGIDVGCALTVSAVVMQGVLLDGTLTKIKDVVTRKIVLVKQHPLSVISDKSRREMNLGHQIEHSHVQQTPTIQDGSQSVEEWKAEIITLLDYWPSWQIIYTNNKTQRSWSPFDAKIGTNVAGCRGPFLGGGSQQLPAAAWSMMWRYFVFGGTLADMASHCLSDLVMEAAGKHEIAANGQLSISGGVAVTRGGNEEESIWRRLDSLNASVTKSTAHFPQHASDLQPLIACSGD